jgi:molybdate transport system substrate-binding protein
MRKLFMTGPLKGLLVLGAGLLIITGNQAMADEIKVLSAGAMQRGLVSIAQSFKARGGHELKIAYATAPELRRILTERDAAADVLLAPNPTVAELSKSGKLIPQGQMEIGGVGSAVLIRPDAPMPDLSSLAAFKRSLTEADALVYNRASSGVYIDSMLHKLGLFEQVEGKIVRVDDGEAVATRIKQGRGRELGFGGYTDVLHNQDMGGVKLAGPIPDEVQNYTIYSSSLIAKAPNPEAARAFLAYLETPDAHALFQASGVVAVRH